MYPAIEIDLHLDRICAAQRESSAAREAAFRALDVRHQPAPPLFRYLAKGVGRAVVIAGEAKESRRCG